MESSQQKSKECLRDELDFHHIKTFYCKHIKQILSTKKQRYITCGCKECRNVVQEMMKKCK